MGAWGTLKHTTNTKLSQKEMMGICINPGAAKSLWLCCAVPDSDSAPAPEPWGALAGGCGTGTLPGIQGGKLSCGFPPASVEGDVCLSPQDMS